MGMAVILVMWPGPIEQTSVPASYGISIWNLSSIGTVVLEKKMFENVIGILLAHSWAFHSGELKCRTGIQHLKKITKLEMCQGDTDAPLLQICISSKTKSKMTF